MAEPITMGTLLTALGSKGGLAALGGTAKGAAEGIMGRKTLKQREKESKRTAREKKRATLADLLNAAMSREFEAGEGMRKRGGDLATQRAQALQNIASQYVQALR